MSHLSRVAQDSAASEVMSVFSFSRYLRTRGTVLFSQPIAKLSVGGNQVRRPYYGLHLAISRWHLSLVKEKFECSLIRRSFRDFLPILVKQGCANAEAAKHLVIDVHSDRFAINLSSCCFAQFGFWNRALLRLANRVLAFSVFLWCSPPGTFIQRQERVFGLSSLPVATQLFID